jgi:hypothetical protein
MRQDLTMFTMSYDDGEGDIPEITLGWRLRIAMERADLKAEEMASELGVHRGTITRWTHDIGSPPRAIYLHRWADLCHVSFAWLAGDLADPSARSAAGRVTTSNSRVSSRSNRGCVTTTRRRDTRSAVCVANAA